MAIDTGFAIAERFSLAAAARAASSAAICSAMRSTEANESARSSSAVGFAFFRLCAISSFSLPDHSSTTVSRNSSSPASTFAQIGTRPVNGVRPTITPFTNTGTSRNAPLKLVVSEKFPIVASSELFTVTVFPLCTFTLNFCDS